MYSLKLAVNKPQIGLLIYTCYLLCFVLKLETSAITTLKYNKRKTLLDPRKIVYRETKN